MAQTVCVIPSATDLAHLSTIVADRAQPLKHIRRARIVLLSAEPLSVPAPASRPCGAGDSATPKKASRDCYATRSTRHPTPPAPSPGAGSHLLRAARRDHPLDRPRPGAVRRDLSAVVPAHRGRTPPPAASGPQLQALERWPSLRSSRTSSASAWIRRATPPCSRSPILRQAQDEESQIHALERTRPSRPVTPGRPGTQTHDDVRHGTTTLFAALDVLQGTVIGRCMQRHRHDEFLRFLNTNEAAVPASKLIHVILANDATHKPPKVRA